MATKSYLCALLNNGTTDFATIFDPVDGRLMVKQTWDWNLIDATTTSMLAELQVTYGGTMTSVDNGPWYMGVSSAGEALWAFGIGATNPASSTFYAYIKVMAFSSTARTVSTVKQLLTKKSGDANAQPVYMLGFNYDAAYLGCFVVGAAPNVLVYEMKPSGVVSATTTAASTATPDIPALIRAAGQDYLAYSDLSAGNQAGYLVQKVSGVWTQVATVAGASASLYPLSQKEALAAAAGLSPTYTVGLGQTGSNPLAQGKDAFGSYQINSVTLTNLVTMSTVNLQPAFDSAVAGTATVSPDLLVFAAITDLPNPPFWQGKVLADEIV